MTRLGLLALALWGGLALGQEEGADPVPPRVLQTYETGKAAYDAKDYSSALVSFDRCVELEPARARWHYNRGLALKKLKRNAEAIEAFHDSRRMDPAYKKAEIDQKLSELGSAPGPAPAPPTEGAPEPDRSVKRDRIEQWLGFAFCAAVVAAIGFVVRLVTRARKVAETPRPLGAKPAEHGAATLEPALNALAARQAPLEHALAPDDDPEARALVEQAGHELQFARFLAQSRADLAKREANLARATAAVDAARKHFEALNRPGWDQRRGERVGCFFCSRPLAARSARRGVELTTAGGAFAVVACEHCAKKATSSAAATVRMLGAGAQQVHWAQVPSFDPYQHGHWGGPPSRDVEAWRVDLSGERLSALGPLVGLASVGGAAVVLGAFDLFGAREAGLAAEAAAAAAAASAPRSGSSSSTRWNDHS